MTTIISGTSGLTFPDNSTQAVGFYGFKNRIINGAMVIDQRNAGASIVPASGSFPVDRFMIQISQASKITTQQNAGGLTGSNLPTGFQKYLGVTTTTAATIGSTDYFLIRTIFEGNNTYDFNFGTANAKTITLSFWVYSSVAGTFGGSLTNAAENRSYPFTYTVSSANTWTYITITIPGDTGGTWVGASNAASMQINWSLGMGATYSGTAGAWAATAYLSATGATATASTLNATFYITGVQLEKGSTATSFDYRPYGTELMLCQRYYEKSYDIDVIPGSVSSNGYDFIYGSTDAGQNALANIRFKVSKRAPPTVLTWTESTGTAGNWNYVRNGVSATATATTVSPIGTNGCRIYGSAGAAWANVAWSGQWTASSEL